MTEPPADLDHLRQLVERITLEPADVRLRTGEVYDALLIDAAALDEPNFTRIVPDDLRRLFDLYDEEFFAGLCGRLARSGGNTLSFRLSPRMTSVAGTTLQRRPRGGGPAQYEIAISTTLLFGTFADAPAHGNGSSVPRTITVSGVECRDRLEALQRVMEHEMLHLVEMLVWDRSSCAASRFRSMARRLFDHRESTHRLITPREAARERFGIRPGDHVAFTFEGRRLVGRVNRVTRRATVLVPDPRGERFSDGGRYTRYYVPLSQLEPI
jgi:hypothetical protein